MAEYTVTSPDGRSIKVQAADGASDAELIQLAQGQMAATSAPATTSEKMLASAPGRIAKGMKDPIDAGAQLLPRGLASLTSAFGLLPNQLSEWFDKEAQGVDAGIKASEQDYQAARWKSGQSGFDGARLLGNVVNPTTYALAKVNPAGAVTTLGRAAQGAMGGLSGGVLATPVTDTSEMSFAAQKAGQGVAGAVGGAVIGPLVGKVVDIVAPRIKALAAKFTDPSVLGAKASLETDIAIQTVMRDMGTEAQNIPDQVIKQLRQQVLASFKQGQKFDAAATLRKADFEAQGVPALRGQITRNPAQYSRDMNVRGIEGVGEPVQNALSAQNQKITRDLAKFGGPKALDRVQAGDMLIPALKKFDEQKRGAVTRAYQNARASSGKDWDVPMKGFASDVGEILDTFGTGLGEPNNIPGAIVKNLKSFGVIADDAMTQRRVFNYEQADKLLKQINAHDNGQNASLKPLRDAVKKAILEAGGDGDPFAPARKLAAERFALHDSAPALDAVIKGKASADDFVQKYIIGGKVKELKALADLFPQEQMAEAKKQIARAIYDGAFRGNAAGDKAASPAGLQNAMKGIGPERLKVFFSQPEIDELNRLTRITAYANSEPAWGTVARGGNPGGVLLGGIAKLGGAGAALGRSAPLVGAAQNSLRVGAAMNTAIPKSANLTPEESAALSRLIGLSGVAGGNALAPRP